MLKAGVLPVELHYLILTALEEKLFLSLIALQLPSILRENAGSSFF